VKKGSKTPAKIFLVLYWQLVKVTPNMKRISTLIVLLGLVFGTLLTGCSKDADQSSAPASTNAPAAPSTNK